MERRNSIPSPIPDGLDDAIAAARALQAALNGAFIERAREVRSLLLALVAEEHILLLGPPGTGKSALTTALCRALGGRYFELLLTKFSVPEEVFGPISLQGLERDEYRRVTAGYLPEAEVAFLDEIFKANSSILNALLTALNEGAFDNGGKRQPIPLKLCVGASNEFPEDDALAALYDRFVLRHWVEPIASRDNLRSLLATAGEPRVAARLTAEQVATLRGARELVQVPDDVLDAVMDLRDRLMARGITASDRRWRKCMKLVRAAAVLDGRLVATVNDILPLTWALWEDRESIPAVHGAVAEVRPHYAEALRLLDAATEEYGKVDFKADKATREGTEAMARANQALKAITERLAALPDDDDIESVRERVGSRQRQIAKHWVKLLGI